MTIGTGETDVGKCPYTTFDEHHDALMDNDLPKNSSDLNEFMCDVWNREGYLYSKCKDGYGLAIQIANCVKCNYDKRVGWLLPFVTFNHLLFFLHMLINSTHHMSGTMVH